MRRAGAVSRARRGGGGGRARAPKASKILRPPKLTMSRSTRTIGVFPTRKRALVSKARVNRSIDRSQRTLKVSPARDNKHHVLTIKPLSLG